MWLPLYLTIMPYAPGVPHIGRSVRYRLGDRVTHWILVNQINMVAHEGFNHVDQDDYGNGSGRRIPKESYAWMQRVVASNGSDL